MASLIRSDVLAAAMRGERFHAATVPSRPTSLWSRGTAMRPPRAISPLRVLDNARARLQLERGRRIVSPSIYYSSQAAAMRIATYHANPAISAKLPLRPGLPTRRIMSEPGT